MAFTPNVWVSPTTGDWNTAGNWSLNLVPTTSHDPVFDGTSQVSVTTTLDRTADGTWGTDRQLLVTKNYTGSIGGTGNPLKMNFTGLVKYQGAGDEFWFENLNATGVLRFIAAPRIRGTNACVIDGKVIDLAVIGGRATLDSSAILTGFVYVMADPESAVPPLLVAGTGATVSGTKLIQTAGEIQSGLAWPDVNIRGGYFRHDSGTIAAAVLSGGEYQPNAGTVTTLHHLGSGKFDGAKYRGWTVTLMHAGDGAVVDLRNGAGKVPTTFRQYPGLTLFQDAAEV